MYNDQKTRNEGQTLCTMIRRQGTKENNMPKGRNFDKPLVGIAREFQNVF